MGCHEHNMLELVESLRKKSNEAGAKLIAAYEGSFYHDNKLVLATQFLEGGDLVHYMNSWHPKATGVSLDVWKRTLKHAFHEMALSPAFLAEHGIFHRDISLENYVLSGGKVKLIDFD